MNKETSAEAVSSTATEQTSPETSTVEPTSSRPSFVASSALILVIVALGAFAWHWLETRERFTQIEQVLTLRLEQFSQNNQQSLAVSRLADERSIEASARISLLEQKLAESRNQQ
ncbi:MAG: heme biosynthesis operon protein HemX, partial [Nitrosomonadales bacterium]|nr:heme biosynthesis operon protein HemX [Nitrosomonadales bacterium]